MESVRYIRTILTKSGDQISWKSVQWEPHWYVQAGRYDKLNRHFSQPCKYLEVFEVFICKARTIPSSDATSNTLPLQHDMNSIQQLNNNWHVLSS